MIGSGNVKPRPPQRAGLFVLMRKMPQNSTGSDSRNRRAALLQTRPAGP